MKIEKILKEDIFVSDQYCINKLDKDEWKRFLKILGVNDGINTIHYSQKMSKALLINEEINKEYFQTSDMVFKPYMSSFRADEFINIYTLTLVNHTLANNKFSNVFWRDYLDNPFSFLAAFMAWPKALKLYFSTLHIIIISPYYILLFEFWFGYDCTYHSADCNRAY